MWCVDTNIVVGASIYEDDKFESLNHPHPLDSYSFEVYHFSLDLTIFTESEFTSNSTVRKCSLVNQWSFS